MTPTNKPHPDPAVAEQLVRYHGALHAMQTGVAFKMNYDRTDSEPKHLRVGVNSAMVEHSGLAKLLIDKGIITELEYYTALADFMERERDLYQAWINQRYPDTTIRLA